MSLDKHFFLAFLFVILEQSSAALGSPPTPYPFPLFPPWAFPSSYLPWEAPLTCTGSGLGAALIVGAGLVGEGEVEGGSCKEKNEWSVRDLIQSTRDNDNKQNTYNLTLHRKVVSTKAFTISCKSKVNQ